jgi:hypothetical protein
MAIHTVITTITGIFTYTDLYLQGKEILLSYDGNQTYKSTDQFDLTDSLVFQWIGEGLSYQSWTVSIQIAAIGGASKPVQWTHSGQIPAGGGSQLYQEIPLGSTNVGG